MTDAMWLKSPVSCIWCGAELKVRRIVPFDVVHKLPACPEMSDPSKVQALRVVALTAFELVPCEVAPADTVQVPS